MTPFWRVAPRPRDGAHRLQGQLALTCLARAGAEIVGYSDGVPTQPSLYEDARVDALLTSVEGDVRDGRHLAREIERHRPDIVFHLAAQALVRRSYAEPVETYETNVIGTVNVLEAVRDADVERGGRRDERQGLRADSPAGGIPEDDPLGGADPYSSSKAAAELVTAAYRRSFFGSGARAGSCDGPRRERDRRRRLGGGPARPGHRARADSGAAARDSQSECRPAVAARPRSGRGIPPAGRTALRGHGRRRARGTSVRIAPVARRWSSSHGMLPPPGAPSSSSFPRRRPRVREAPSLELDATRGADELGWRPRWDLERAVRETADWYRRQAAGADATRRSTFAQIDAHLHDAPRPPVVSMIASCRFCGAPSTRLRRPRHVAARELVRRRRTRRERWSRSTRCARSSATQCLLVQLRAHRVARGDLLRLRLLLVVLDDVARPRAALCRRAHDRAVGLGRDEPRGRDREQRRLPAPVLRRAPGSRCSASSPPANVAAVADRARSPDRRRLLRARTAATELRREHRPTSASATTCSRTFRTSTTSSPGSRTLLKPGGRRAPSSSRTCCA